jgi:predicted  nucleic acid-binding Zn-ribbon protein
VVDREAKAVDSESAAEKVPSIDQDGDDEDFADPFEVVKEECDYALSQTVAEESKEFMVICEEYLLGVAVRNFTTIEAESTQLFFGEHSVLAASFQLYHLQVCESVQRNAVIDLEINDRVTVCAAAFGEAECRVRNEIVMAESIERLRLSHEQEEEEKYVRFINRLQAAKCEMESDLEVLSAHVVSGESMLGALLEIDSRTKRLNEKIIQINGELQSSSGSLARASHTMGIVGNEESLRELLSWVTEVEQEAADRQSSLLPLWVETVSSFPIENVDHGDLNMENLPDRLQQCRLQHEVLWNRANELYMKREREAGVLASMREIHKKSLKWTFDCEAKVLETVRRQHKQVDEEQQFHVRRGTFVKERQVAAFSTHDELLMEKAKSDHTTLCAALLRVQDDISVTKNELADLERTFRDHRREFEVKKHAHDVTLCDLTTDGQTFDAERTKLEEEAEDLKILKQDLTKVLQYVRLHNRT